VKIRQKVLVSLLGCITILALLLVGCTSGANTTNPPPSPTNPPPLISSGLVVKMSLDDLAAKANLVILGKVVNVVYQKEANGNIYTLVTFSVEQIFKGETAQEMVISVPGGKFDGLIQLVEGTPTFQLSERAVVFLEKGDGIFRVIGGFQGEFTINEGNMVGNVPLQQFVIQVNNAIAK
jgi:hypothetical protein